jgi:hypothetical protein
LDVSRDLPLRHRKDGREVEHEEQNGPEGDEQPDRLYLEQVEERLHYLSHDPETGSMRPMIGIMSGR